MIYKVVFRRDGEVIEGKFRGVEGIDFPGPGVHLVGLNYRTIAFFPYENLIYLEKVEDLKIDLKIPDALDSNAMKKFVEEISQTLEKTLKRSGRVD